MSKADGFMKIKRINPEPRPIKERIRDFREIYPMLATEDLITQAARCMDCGVPFCHGTGCPVENIIPEFNELIFRGRWRDALETLHSTNNFPEFTGRVCPALCESACVVALHDSPVSIRQIELQIVEKGFEEGWVVPRPAETSTGKSVAVVGSGPAGLACAQQLARAGHRVVVYEKKDRPGGLLRYGIPDFKLEKGMIDRRLQQLEAEGIEFRNQVFVGHDVSARYLARQYDALCLAGGAMLARDLQVPGRELQGIYQAMEYLEQQNRRAAGEKIPDEDVICAAGKRAVVIGGGDTGADCVGTAIRQGAKEVWQLEILPKPPENTNPDTPWPSWPNILRTSTSHDEGCIRRWSVMTRKFGGRSGIVEKLYAVEVDYDIDKGKFVERPGTEFELQADLVLLAMGFVHPVHEGMISELELSLDTRGNIEVDGNCKTSRDNVFSAGDMAIGASLVVRAISQGRRAARGIDKFLMGESCLP